MTPMVSVIVPVYNAESYIRQCIESILAQTFSDLELILIDDGSTDNSVAVCKEYCNRRNVVFLHQENAGVAAARNKGIELSKGNYIVFVDSDDTIKPSYIEDLISYNEDLVICGMTSVTEDGRELYTNNPPKLCFESITDFDWSTLYGRLLLYSVYCKLFRADILRSNKIAFPTQYSWGEDAVFVADYIKHIDSLRVISACGYRYTAHTGDASLATKIRPTIINEISDSRCRVLELVRSISEEAYREIKPVCEEDIRKNCSYFVSRVFTSKMSNNEKRKLLTRFFSNEYVAQTISSASQYYPDNPALRNRYIYNSVFIVLLSYNFHVFLSSCKTKLLKSFHRSI